MRDETTCVPAHATTGRRSCSPDLHDPADAGEAVLGPVAGLDHGEGDVPVQEVALVLMVLILPGQGQCLQHFK